MNRSVKETAETVLPAAVSVRIRTHRRVWPIMVSFILFPLLKFGIGGKADSLVVSVAALGAAYAVAIHLYCGIAFLAYRRSDYLLWSGGLLALAIGFVGSGMAHVRELLFGWGMVFFTGIAVGRLAATTVSDLTKYVVGVVIVASCTLAVFVPQWSAMRDAVSVVSEQIAEGARTGFLPALLGPAIVGGYVMSLEKALNVAVRLLPMFVVMSAVVQYSAGFLWFAAVRSGEEFRRSPLSLFIYWRVPRFMLPVVAAAVLSSLAGGETVRLVADNLLAALSVYYCVAGLALTEYYLRRFRFHWSLKAAVYLLLILTGLIGYFALVLLGLTISLSDWRRPLDVG